MDPVAEDHARASFRAARSRDRSRERMQRENEVKQERDRLRQVVAHLNEKVDQLEKDNYRLRNALGAFTNHTTAARGAGNVNVGQKGRGKGGVGMIEGHKGKGGK